MNRLLAAVGLVIGLVVLSATPASAATIVNNGSFEAGFPSAPDNNAWQTVGYREDIAVVPGWTETADGVDWHRNVPVPGSPAAQDGSRLIDLVGAGGRGKIQQAIPTTSGAHYTLSFFYAANPACVGTGTATARATAGSASLELQARGSNSYTPATLAFTAVDAFTTISFQSVTGGLACPGGVTIDNVSASCTTPPPPGATSCVTGTAAIRGKTGCQGTPFRVLVSGREIERVVFTMDGKFVSAVTRPNVGVLYTFPVNPRTLRIDVVHRVRARVIFTRRSGMADRTLLPVTFRRCGRRATSPAFSDAPRQCDQARVDIVQLEKQLNRVRGERRKRVMVALNEARKNERLYC